MVFRSFKRLAINYFIKPKSCRKGSGRSHFFQEIISTQFAGNNPTEPLGATPLHHPSSICSIFVIISSGSNEISVSSPGVMKKKDTMRNQPRGDTVALVTNLDFHSTKNRYCDWLILGHVPLVMCPWSCALDPDWETVMHLLPMCQIQRYVLAM